jgi:hypothetical protein
MSPSGFGLVEAKGLSEALTPFVAQLRVEAEERGWSPVQALSHEIDAIEEICEGDITLQQRYFLRLLHGHYEAIMTRQPKDMNELMEANDRAASRFTAEILVIKAPKPKPPTSE